MIYILLILVSFITGYYVAWRRGFNQLVDFAFKVKEGILSISKNPDEVMRRFREDHKKKL